jgi:hypothetical protein
MMSWISPRRLFYSTGVFLVNHLSPPTNIPFSSAHFSDSPWLGKQQQPRIHIFYESMTSRERQRIAMFAAIIFGFFSFFFSMGALNRQAMGTGALSWIENFFFA